MIDEPIVATPVDHPCERCGRLKSEHEPTFAVGPPTTVMACGFQGDVSESFRRRVADMPRIGLAPHQRVPLGLYRHHKGGLYEVTGGSFDATGDGDEVVVVYRSVDEGYQAHRTVEDFLGTVEHDGRRVPRFRMCGSLSPLAPEADAIDLLREWLAKFGRTIRVMCDGDLDRRTEEVIGAWERRAKGGAVARAGAAMGSPCPTGMPNGGGGTGSPAAVSCEQREIGRDGP